MKMKNIFIATNNGDIGGGEVMLLNIARALRALGKSVTIVGPTSPNELIEAAKDEGFSTVILPAHNRKSYLAQLRLWRYRNRQNLLWCNGLVPAFATAGLGPRIVHLHQLPQRLQKFAAKISSRGALGTLVPSEFMSEKISGTIVLPNWVSEVSTTPMSHNRDPQNITVGFLGRVSEIKGTDLLAQAIYHLNQSQNNFRFKLVIGGEARFVSDGTRDRVTDSLEKLEDNLVTLGWTEPADFFAQVDCVAMPSQWDEPFGLVAAEAMSAKVPLLVTRSGALPSIVGEEYPWIVERGNAKDIEWGLLDLAQNLTSSSNRLQKIVTDNYWRWYENFSPEAGKNGVKKVLEQLV